MDSGQLAIIQDNGVGAYCIRAYKPCMLVGGAMFQMGFHGKLECYSGCLCLSKVHGIVHRHC